jgi:hypothetical protein
MLTAHRSRTFLELSAMRRLHAAAIEIKVDHFVSDRLDQALRPDHQGLGYRYSVRPVAP